MNSSMFYKYITLHLYTRRKQNIFLPELLQY